MKNSNAYLTSPWKDCDYRLEREADRILDRAFGKKLKKPARRPDYYTYIISRAWRARRRQHLNNVGWKCEVCGARKFLEVHHLTYDRLGREKRKDLQVLCKPCHEKCREGYIDPDAASHLKSIAAE